MNPSRSDTSNTNAKKEDIPISMPNIQLPFIIRFVGRLIEKKEYKEFY